MGVHGRSGIGESHPRGELPRGEVFDILGNDRRRYAVSYLLSNGPSEIGELAVQVAAREYDTEPAAVASDQRHRVYATLRQTHLPRLTEAGVVEEEGDRVHLTDRGVSLRRYLERDPSDGWAPAYVSLGAVSAVTLCVASFGMFGVSLGATTVAAITVVGFVALAAVQIGRRAQAPSRRRGSLEWP